MSEHMSTEQVSTNHRAVSSAPEQVLTKQRTTGDRLRLISPIASLGAAATLQVIAVTDLLGGALTKQLGNWAYLVGALFGIAVACAAEGGAAHLMALYEKHLLGGDSTWVLRVGMIAYVAASAGALHWWAQSRGLPTILSWLLAAMSASALFLWSRESRWKHREHMRETGLVDTALPRLSTAAKVLHPIRSLITVWLISWDQASTTDEARARYTAWSQGRRNHSAPISAPEQVLRVSASTEHVSTDQSAPIEQGSAQHAIPGAERRAPSAEQALTGEVLTDQDNPSTEQDAEQVSTEQVRTITERVITEQVRTTRTKASTEQLAATLDQAFQDRVPGKPSALRVLRAEYGSCSEPRAKAAIGLLREQRERQATS